MEATLDALVQRIDQLQLLTELRAPPPSTTSSRLPSSPHPSLAFQTGPLLAHLDDLDRRIASTRTALAAQRQQLEADGRRHRDRLEASNAALNHMLENMPRHLPMASFPAAPPGASENGGAAAEPPKPTELKPPPPASAVKSAAKGKGAIPVPVTPVAIKSNLAGRKVEKASKLNLGAAKAAEPATVDRTVAKDDSPATEMEDGESRAESRSSGRKMSMAILPITIAEYETIPKYLLPRGLPLPKLNDHIAELNKILAEKYTTLRIPPQKMSKAQRERFWEHKKQETGETKGKAFVTEQDIKENWAKAAFKLDPAGRGVVAAIRHLGRIKEVRGGGCTRIVVM
ncbi:Spindle and kinetochore-associated protein 1 [Phlyctochytrium bullatum]|nr:Spindle and kinetochore-associated protein 1 [Phlyctochytrium bullatum]